MTNSLTISEIKNKLKELETLEDPFVQQCRMDQRKGVQVALSGFERAIARKVEERRHFDSISVFENQLREEGYQYIVGIDEAGRGPLAGPVVAGAVILPENFYLAGLTDSKKLSAAKREQYYEYILENALAVGVGIIHSEEIDKINIYEAAKKAMLSAVNQLKVFPEYALIDAMKLDLPIPQMSLIKGDAKSISIAAASVIAKETRDRLMKEYAEIYPQYGFDKHMGYGTSSHLEAIEKYGPLDWHRMTFAPLKNNY
jgi:ribonuclease HII